MLEMKPERESKVIRVPRETSEKLSYISEQTGMPVSQVARRLMEYAMEHVTLKKIPQYYMMFDEE